MATDPIEKARQWLLQRYTVGQPNVELQPAPRAESPVRVQAPEPVAASPAVPKNREPLLPITLAIVALVLGARLLHIQFWSQETFASRARRQQVSEETVLARPGDLRDRQGRLLATTITAPSLYVDPSRIEPTSDLPHQLARILGIDPVDLSRKIQDNQHRHFLWVQRRISDEAATAFTRLKISPDIAGLRREQQRYYPQGKLAAHVIGLRNIDGRGQGGAEEAFHDLLTGTNGVRRFVRDARGYILDELEEVTRPPVNGQSVTLTIDIVLQMSVEQQLDALCAKHEPLGACAIVLDPRSGEVLALASRPTFDPAHPELAKEEDWKNLALSAVFEPGSTFKPLVVAWGLHHHLLGRDEVFDCERGAYRMGRRVLHDHHRYGNLSVTDVLVKSSNIGMAKIGQRLGNDELFALATAFGFGSKTGFELPGELPGLLRPRQDWDSYSTGSIPMGQEIAATPLQMITAHATLANRGVHITPHILLKSSSDHSLREGEATAGAQGSESSRSTVVIARVVEEEVARWVVEEPMVEVVERGTAKQAQLKGVKVFGKTGTAQKTKTDGAGYSSSRHVSSFIGGAPAENPQLLVLVSVDEPTGAAQFGGSVAGPYAAAILKAGLEHLRDETPAEPQSVARVGDSRESAEASTSR